MVDFYGKLVGKYMDIDISYMDQPNQSHGWFLGNSRVFFFFGGRSFGPTGCGQGGWVDGGVVCVFCVEIFSRNLNLPFFVGFKPTCVQMYFETIGIKKTSEELP